MKVCSDGSWWWVQRSKVLRRAGRKYPPEYRLEVLIPVGFSEDDKAKEPRKGVDCENMNDERFNLRDQMEEFVKNGGKIYACGTCLKIRDSSPELCPVSMVEDMYEIVKESDRVLTF